MQLYTSGQHWPHKNLKHRRYTMSTMNTAITNITNEISVIQETIEGIESFASNIAGAMNDADVAQFVKDESRNTVSNYKRELFKLYEKRAGLSVQHVSAMIVSSVEMIDCCDDNSTAKVSATSTCGTSETFYVQTRDGLFKDDCSIINDLSNDDVSDESHPTFDLDLIIKAAVDCAQSK